MKKIVQITGTLFTFLVGIILCLKIASFELKKDIDVSNSFQKIELPENIEDIETFEIKENSEKKTEKAPDISQKDKVQSEDNISKYEEKKSEKIIKSPRKEDYKEEKIDEFTNIIPEEKLEKNEIWKEFGLTEDEYNNQPMFPWEKIDFKTMEECLNYGDKYEPYKQGEELYNCREVLSVSGNYLGVMFDTEKLK